MKYIALVQAILLTALLVDNYHIRREAANKGDAAPQPVQHQRGIQILPSPEEILREERKNEDIQSLADDVNFNHSAALFGKMKPK